jgi:DNA-binding transcriptional LysR family regulator
MKFVWLLAAAAIVAATPALSQQRGAPVLSDSALNMNMHPEDCLRRAENAFRAFGWRPVRYPTSVFGDDGQHHLVIRCSHSNIGVIFFAGAGGRQPGGMVDRLKDAFMRTY